MKKLSCIICAYNEGPRIGAVLEAVIAHPLLDEVIVVDDGSSDDTAHVVRSFPSVRLISHMPNRGKTRALSAGILASKNDFVFLLDADLKGFTAEDVTAMVQPVLSGQADMSISVRKNSLGLFRAIGLDFVSGERVVPKSIFGDITQIESLPSFGIEAWMNERIIEHQLTIAIVWLENTMHIRKMEKTGWWKGHIGELKTALDVLSVLSPLKIIRQNYAMLSLSSDKLAETRLAKKASTEASHE